MSAIGQIEGPNLQHPNETPVCDKPAPLLVPADCTLGISLPDCCWIAVGLPVLRPLTVCVRAQGDSDRIFTASLLAPLGKRLLFLKVLSPNGQRRTNGYKVLSRRLIGVSPKTGFA